MQLEFPLTAIPSMRGRRVRYVPNHRSFGAFMRSEQMRDVTADAAGDIAKLAATTVGPANSNEPSDMFPAISKGFEVKRESGYAKVGGNLRVLVEVINEADGVALVEFGARQFARRRMLGRAGAKFGDFKPEGGPT